MDPFGIAFLLIAVAVPAMALMAAFYLMMRAQTRHAERQQQRLKDLEARQKRGVWASATVVTYRSESGPALLESQNKLKVNLRLDVQSPGGRVYPAHAVWLVDLGALDNVQPGQTVSIKIDPKNKKTIYPNAPWAQPWPYD